LQDSLSPSGWQWFDRAVAMARNYLVFGDIEGKLDVLRVEWTKCDRKGRYSVAKLIENTAAGATW
jgi:hypothetical protein